VKRNRARVSAEKGGGKGLEDETAATPRVTQTGRYIFLLFIREFDFINRVKSIAFKSRQESK
jgi:hypothetical protein